MHPLNIYCFLALTISALAAPIAEQKHNTRCKHQYCLASHQHYRDETGSFCRATQRVSTTHECSASASSCSVCSNLYNRLDHAVCDFVRVVVYLSCLDLRRNFCWLIKSLFGLKPSERAIADFKIIQCSDISKHAPYITVPNMLSGSRVRQVAKKFDV
jgi:hypothetical protein